MARGSGCGASTGGNKRRIYEGDNMGVEGWEFIKDKNNMQGGRAHR